MKVPASVLTDMEDLRRLSFELEDLHTVQVQVITGTPCEVPVPSTVTIPFLFNYSSSDVTV